MYKKLTAEDYRKHFKLPSDYKVDGFIVYGTYKKHPFEQFEDSIQRTGQEYTKVTLDSEFFGSLLEFNVGGKRFWVAIAYGGALLSEYLHLACLFGSQANILIGSCGGLKKGIHELELIVPEWSHANESSAAAYESNANSQYYSNKQLSDTVAGKLAEQHQVHRGATITFQAMLAETRENILDWSNKGFVAVEMEAATVFAVSNHFKVPSAAILMIGDNLIEEQTVVDINYENSRNQRRAVAQTALDIALDTLLKS